MRQEDRDAAADAQKLDVLDGPQAAQQVPETPIGEEQRVAAGQEHVADLGVFLQVVDRAVEIEFELLLAHATDDAAARAVAAIGGAPVGDEKEHAVGITMDQPGHGHVMVLAARVGQVGRFVGHLLDARNDLTADRAIGIERIDQVKEVGRDAHGQLGIGEENPGMLFAGQLDLSRQVIERFDTMPHLPLPVVPLLRGGVGPVTLAG